MLPQLFFIPHPKELNHDSPESPEYFLLNLPILALNEPNQTLIFAPKSKHLISNL